MNLELKKIYEVERRYGTDCWTRTDEAFVNDTSVQYIRTLKREEEETFVTKQLISSLLADITANLTVQQMAYRYGLSISCVSTLVKTLTMSNSVTAQN